MKKSAKMKKLLLLIALCLFSLISKANVLNKKFDADTTHEVDGNLKEWSDSSFKKDAATNISYAIANTDTHLFVALKCTDQRIQLKLMRLGMQMYIDVKGKHREGMGVGFPVKNENIPVAPQQVGQGFGGRNQDAQQDGQSRTKPDFKAMKQMFAMNLFTLNLFGFDGVEDKKQGLSQQGSINIAFSWDDNEVMYIEYSVPLSYINNNVAALKGKSLAIGWKINGMEMPSSFSSNTPSFSGATGRAGGGRGGNSFTQPGGSNNNGNSYEAAIKEQSFWGKYDIKL